MAFQALGQLFAELVYEIFKFTAQHHFDHHIELGVQFQLQVAAFTGRCQMKVECEGERSGSVLLHDNKRRGLSFGNLNAHLHSLRLGNNGVLGKRDLSFLVFRNFILKT